MKPEESFARASAKLLVEEPFFGLAILRFDRIFTEQVETAGVGPFQDRLALRLNPVWFQTLKAEEQVAVLKHEVLHVALNHLGRRPEFGTDSLAWNLACDLTVNQYLKPWPALKGSVLLSDYPGWPPFKSAEFYFEKLPRKDLPSMGPLTHRFWTTSPESEAWWDHQKSQIADLVSEDQWGKMPSVLVHHFTARKESALAWKQLLRLFVQSVQTGTVVSRMMRPSRRYGTQPGPRRTRRPKLLVAIDSSGSISDDQIDLFVAEIDNLARLDCEIMVLVCDAKVQSAEPWRRNQRPTILGRGGTDFDPVMRWADDSGQRWDGLIYLTDGDGTLTHRPRSKVLWVLTRPKTLPFGRTVIMDEGKMPHE